MAYYASVAAVTLSPNIVGFGSAARTLLFRLINTHPSSRKHIFAAQVLGCMVCHKVHAHKEYHSVCPLIGIGTLASECAPPPEPGGGGGTLAWGEGLGSHNSDDWRKSLTLCLLCGFGLVFYIHRFSEIFIDFILFF